MSYRRRRGLGGGRTGKAGGQPDRREGSLAADPAVQDTSNPGEGSDAAPQGTPPSDSPPPRSPTLKELFTAPVPQRAATPSGNGRRGRWLVSLALAAAFLGGGYLVAAQWVLPGGRASADPSLVEVPELVGLTDEQARGRLERRGLEYIVRSGVTHPLAPEGAVLAQDPLPGQFSRPGAPVYVSLSRGAEIHVLPDVAGLSERQAVIVLERLGYSVAVERRTHTLEQGRAIETQPEAGTELAVPAEVRLVVSEGRPVVRVPDLVGRHVDDAAEALSSGGLEIGAITYDPQAMEAPGRIVGQYPPPGYSLRQGSRVEVRVAGTVDRVDPTRQWFEPDRPND